MPTVVPVARSWCDSRVHQSGNRGVQDLAVLAHDTPRAATCGRGALCIRKADRGVTRLTDDKHVGSEAQTTAEYPAGQCKSCAPICDFCQYYYDWSQPSVEPDETTVMQRYDREIEINGTGWCMARNAPTFIDDVCDNFLCGSLPRVPTHAPSSGTKEAVRFLNSLIRASSANGTNPNVPLVPEDLWPAETERRELTPAELQRVRKWASSLPESLPPKDK